MGSQNLVAIDPPAKSLTFEGVGANPLDFPKRAYVNAGVFFNTRQISLEVLWDEMLL